MAAGQCCFRLELYYSVTHFVCECGLHVAYLIDTVKVLQMVYEQLFSGFEPG